MKVTTFVKASAGLAAAVTMSVGLCVTAANAAGSGLTATQEDPSASAIGANTLVGAGSDTIQDVEYGIGQDLGTDSSGKLELASWTATGKTPMSYRSGGAPQDPTAHPNGSGAGYTVLKESLGISPTTNDGVAPGDVDYSRASGFQGTEASNGAGVVTEIPFAADAISFAAPAGSPFLKTNSGAGLTLADLANIYSGVDQYVDTTTGDLEAAAGPGELPIQAFLPKPGSGSRQFFLQQLNKVNNAVPYGSDKGDSDYPGAYTAADQPYVGALDPSGNPIQEHDASILTTIDSTKAAAIAPFSAAKFIGYHNGLIADPSGKTAGTDYVLVPFDSTSGSVLPYTGDATGAATLSPNPAYKTEGTEGSASVTREVFNIIPTAAVTSPNASAKYRQLYDTFVGKGSKFCLDANTIEAYGFLKDSNCGSTTRTADTASAASVTVSNTPAKAGASTKVTFAVQSNGNGGGVVKATISGRAYTATIAAKATTASITVPTPTAGTLRFNGTFVPNLAGVATTPFSSSIAVAKATPKVTASAPSVKHTVKGKVYVAVSASGVKPTGKVTVTIKQGTRTKLTVANKAISASTGKVTVALTKALPKGTYYVFVSYSGDANTAPKASTKLATLKVS